jgi:Lrp/AsnC family transcriptional regulator, leucine-responsive regulatory protein
MILWLYYLFASGRSVIKVPKSGFPGQIDQFDRKIIEALLDDGRMSVTELARRVGLSKTPCQVRMKRLIDKGYIVGFRAVLDPQKLGLDHVAFAEVRLSDTREKALNEFNAEVKKIKEVEECHMIAGSFDYLLKVRTPDIKKYRHVLGERISSLPHVANTSTFVVMQSVRDNGM